jgi:hypothetical protein
MNKWLAAYLINLYLIYLFFYFGSMVLSFADGVLTVWAVILGSTLITGSGSIISVIKSKAKGTFDKENALKHITRVKLALIPVHFINYMLGVTAVAVSGTPWTFWLLAFVPLFFIFACGILFTTSAHSLMAIINLRREGLITTKGLVFHSFLQFIFILDVLDCVYLYIKKYKQNYGKFKRILIPALLIIIPAVAALVLHSLGFLF